MRASHPAENSKHDPATHGTSESAVASGRFQYSLRTLILILTAAAVICSISMVVDDWGAPCLLEVAFVLVGVLLYVAFRGVSPGWRGLLVNFAISGLLVYVVWSVRSVPSSTALSAALYLSRKMAQYGLPMLPLLLLAWSLWRALRRVPGDFKKSETRRAAVASLLIAASLCCYAAAIVASAHRGNDARGVMLRDRKIRISHVDDRVTLALHLIAAANLAAAIPWIKLDRKRIATLKCRPSSFVDRGARWLLVASMVCAALGGGAAAYLLVRRQYYPPWDWFFAMVFFYALPHLIASGLFVAAIVIQLYRDRWHKVLTSVNCLYFVPLWLLAAWNPRVLLLPF